MIESQQVENPTLNIKKFRKGDPVLTKSFFDKEEIYGFVVRKTGPKLGIWDFQAGYPFYIDRYPEEGTVRKSALEEVIDFYKNISSLLGKTVEEGELEGAWVARNQYCLDVLLSQLQRSRNPREQYQALMRYPKVPQTAVYTLRGYYSGVGEVNHFEGVVCKPRLEERVVAKLMFKLFPQGFRNIPYNFPPVHGILISYGAHEVPKEAVKLVENPAQLRFDYTTNGFTVECTYGVIKDKKVRRYSVTEDFHHKSFVSLVNSLEK